MMITARSIKAVAHWKLNT